MKKDTNELIGKLIESAAVGRDAIHVAVAPVVAREDLVPGQHIGFARGSTELASRSTEMFIGIVDPFLREKVPAGERFFMFLYPRTITSLRHEWSHPADLHEPDELKMHAERVLGIKIDWEKFSFTCSC